MLLANTENNREYAFLTCVSYFVFLNFKVCILKFSLYISNVI